MLPTAALETLIPNLIAIRPRFERWRAVLYTRVEFSLAESAWHTKPHCERVLLFTLAIAQMRGAGDATLETLGAAAAFHDTRRLDDGLDTGHGARAGAYYREFCERAGTPPDELACAVMSWHDRDDAEGEAAIEPRFGAPGIETYRIFKDADGLDRFRLGPTALDERFLRTPEAKLLIPAARTLAEEQRET